MGMKKAIIFISYHPSALAHYAHMRNIYAREYISVLVMCKHPYVNEEIIQRHRAGYDRVILLPDIKYEANIFRMVKNFIAFIRRFDAEIKPVLGAIETFHVVSNASAYLPVNILLSRLKRHAKSRLSISICDELAYKADIDIAKTAYVLLISLIFRIYPVYYNKKLSFIYIRYPIDRIVKFNSSFSRALNPAPARVMSIPVYNVLEPFKGRSGRKKEIVVIYGDTTVCEAYGSDLSMNEYERRLKSFFSALAGHYGGCELVYKPHPLDKGKIMPGLGGIPFKVYEGKLISQLHLDIIEDRVKACYSVASCSLRYSASKGIPSYTFYKYLEFNGEYPRAFFEDDKVFQSPYLYNIQDIGEIGHIDDLQVEPAKSDEFDNWDRIVHTGAK